MIPFFLCIRIAKGIQALPSAKRMLFNKLDLLTNVKVA
jgi:hypothetical protein